MNKFNYYFLLCYLFLISCSLQGMERLKQMRQALQTTSDQITAEDKHRNFDIQKTVVQGKKKIGGFLLGMGCLFTFGAVGTYNEMQKNHSSISQALSFWRFSGISTLCLSAGVNNLFSIVHKENNNYRAIGLFTRITNRFYK